MFEQSMGLKCEIRHLKEYNEKLEKSNKELHERIKLLESGNRCNGRWCDHCVHFGGSDLDYKDGFVHGTRSVCLKDVPCPDFKRRGSPRPNKQEGGPNPR